MKEITRIHIAKIAYDIELAAKKDIERYIEALKKYTDDNELLDDIEIRITELLAERGVSSGGVIAEDDVKAIRAQLGEPQDFLDDTTAVDLDETPGRRSPRKLYRDVDNALLGGVLAGIARYFNIDSVWPRLLFVALMFISFGTAFIVYIVLWIIIPPARSAAEKLQMNGQPVNLTSIRQFVEDYQKKLPTREWAGVLQRVLAGTAGIICLTGAIATLIFTVVATIGLGLRVDPTIYMPGPGWLNWIALALASLSGILLSILFTLCSIAFFKRSLSQKMVTSMIVVIAAGLLSFGAATGIVFYQTNEIGYSYQETQQSQIDLPANFSDVKSLTINGANLNNASIEYIIDSNPRIMATVTRANIKPVTSVDDTLAEIKFEEPSTDYIFGLNLKIYGPALDSLTVKNGSVTYRATDQLNLTAQTLSASLYLTGDVQTLTAIASDNSTISADGATIESAAATTRLMSTVDLGNIKHLEVTQPEVCPGGTSQNNQKVSVESVSDEVFTYNGQSLQAKTYKTQCGSVIIGSNQEVKYDNI